MKGNTGKGNSADKSFWVTFLFYYLWGIITLAGGILLVLVLHFEIYNEVLVYWASVLFGILFIWSIWSWRQLTATSFDAYTLFLISAILFNGGEALLRSVHINFRPSFFEYFGERTVAETLCLVLLGLYAFHVGALVCGKISMRVKNSFQSDDPADFKDIRLVGWVLISISFLPTVLYFQDSLSSVMSYGYFSLFNIRSSDRFCGDKSSFGHFSHSGNIVFADRKQRQIIQSYYCNLIDLQLHICANVFRLESLGGNANHSVCIDLASKYLQNS